MERTKDNHGEDPHIWSSWCKGNGQSGQRNVFRALKMTFARSSAMAVSWSGGHMEKFPVCVRGDCEGR